MSEIVVTSSTVDALLRLSPLAVEEHCPVVHHFGPGVYIREVTLPAGALVVGKTHRHAHMNLMLRGKLELHDEATGAIRVLVAPQMFVSPPGRKVARILDTVVWHNVYATEERDIERLEAWLFEPEARDVEVFDMHRQLRQPERDDFDAFVNASPWSADEVHAISHAGGDCIDFPTGYAHLVVRDSPIEGRGLFATVDVAPGVVAPARIDGKRTPAGRFVNHSHNPNAAFALRADGAIDLVALRPIAGCVGGSRGEEITVDYRQAVALSGVHISRRGSQ